jgi:hypothetical protein
MRAKDILNEDWQKVNKSDKTDGMSSKAVKAYRRENPGSKLKTAVTTKPSKLKKGSKSAKRRKSFCARMSGMKKAHASAKTKRDPDSPINKALRRWNCESIEQSIEQLEQQLTEAKKTLKNSNPCWKGYHPVGTKKKGGRTVPNCVPSESVEEAASAAQQAAIAVNMKKAGKTPKKKVSEAGFPAPHMPAHPLNPLNPLSPTYVAKNRDNLDMDKVTARAKEMFAKGMSEQQVKAELIKQGVAERLANQAVQMGQMNESKKQKQEAPKPRNFVAKNQQTSGAGAHKDKKKADKQGDVKHKGKMLDLAEMEDILEKASRALCTSSTPDKDLGASNLASCKSQGLRARDGEKSHLITAGSRKVRIKVGGKRIKGKKYGGPLPDYGTRK